jgi:hypothetical protein
MESVIPYIAAMAWKSASQAPNKSKSLKTLIGRAPEREVI